MFYHCVMEISSKNAKSSQGVDLENLPVPTLKDVKKWLHGDLGRARALLQALHNNPNLKQLMAEHMLGELENYHNAKKAAAEKV